MRSTISSVSFWNAKSALKSGVHVALNHYLVCHAAPPSESGRLCNSACGLELCSSSKPPNGGSTEVQQQHSSQGAQLNPESTVHHSVPSLVLIAASRTNRDTSGTDHAQIDRCQRPGDQVFWASGYGTWLAVSTMPLFESGERGRYSRD